MVPPSVVGQDSMGRRRLARAFSRSAAVERLLNAMVVVISSELFQLSLQVDNLRALWGLHDAIFGGQPPSP
jgi:hypothetical protein